MKPPAYTPAAALHATATRTGPDRANLARTRTAPLLTGSKRAASRRADLRRRADEIFDHALALEADARGAYIERATEGELRLRSLVQSLIESSDDDDDEALERPTHALEAVRRRLGRNAEEQVGPYRLVREIGHGGMGVVYLGQRVDGVLEQEVAVKILPRSRVRALGERFSRERQILAHLDHPGIARLLDAGSTARGLPYLVMEHVDGETIDRYCDTRLLSLEERLQLFIEVCEAVEAAHRRLVVHRDIKPSNILVTSAGRAKLLDFGIAKLIDENGASQATTSGMLTLEWASPELIQGEPTTVQSDVYQLGLLLHLLLIGRLPYELKGLTPIQQVAAICQEEIATPSTAVRSLSSDELGRRAEELKISSPLDRRLKGDLDAIVMMALRKEPHHRYDSVSALRKDIERHLGQLPITARLPTVGYRTGRFLVRRRLAVVSALLVLFAFAGLGIYAFARITAERNLAQDQAQRAEQRERESLAVTEFLSGMLQRSNPYDAKGQRGELSVREALDLGVEQLDTDLHDSPLVRARVLKQMGELFTILGDHQRSLEMNREAAALYLGFGERGSREHVETLVQLGDAQLELAQNRAARVRYQEALVYSHQIGDPMLTSRIFSKKAIAADISGQIDWAVTYFDQALMYLEGQDSHQARIERTRLLANLGILNKNFGVQRADASALEKAENYTLRALKEADDLPEMTNRKPQIRMNLGNILFEQGRFQEAEATLRWSLDGMQTVFGEGSPQEAMGRNNLGQALTALGRYEEAESELLQALTLRESLFGHPHPKIASVWSRLGRLRLAEGRTAESIEALERALAIRQQVHSPLHPELGKNHLDLAKSHRQLGQHERATVHLEKAVQILEAAGDHERAASAHLELCELEPPAPAREA